jgi:hypothetical protein
MTHLWLMNQVTLTHLWLIGVALVPCVSLLPTCCLFVTEEPSSVSPSTALDPFSWVSPTIDAIVVHSSSEDQLDSDI